MRLPVVPTILVVAAAATMVWLGIWQLHRDAWKRSQVARYETNSRLPPVAWPATPAADDRLLYRHATGFFYAIQWFCFAAAALIIYALALRRRQRDKVAPPPRAS